MKKLSAVILAVVMVLTSLPFTATAAVTKTSDDGLFDYKIIYTDEQSGDTYVEIISYNGSDSEVTVPYELDGYFVKGIKGAFNGNSDVENVTFAEGVEYMEKGSFGQCVLSLETPSSMKYIAPEAFSECEITELKLNEGLVAIDAKAFVACTFDCNVILPDSLKYLGMAAFEECYIESAHIGTSSRPSNDIVYSLSGKVTDGGVYPYELYAWTPFYLNQCPIDVTVSSDNPNLRLDGDILYTGDSSYLLACFGEGGNESVDVDLPEGLKCISEAVFPEGYNIGRLTISSTIEYIGYQALLGTHIEELVFAPNSSLREIGDWAFTSCGIGGDLVIPKSVEDIGDYAFAENSITSLDFELPSSCTEIFLGAFAGCYELKSVFIPNSVTRLGNFNSTDDSEVFCSCSSLESVTFEDNSRVKYWGRDLFTYTAIKNFDTGKNNAVERIYGFDNSLELDVLDLSNCPGLKYIGCSFEYASFREVNLANTALTTISDWSFSYCQNLEKITLPDTLTTIKQYAFYHCDNLREINVDSVLNIGSCAFDMCPSLSEPIEERKEQKYVDFKYIKLNNSVAITGYTGSERNIVIPDEIDGLSVTKIANKAFEKSAITSVSLPARLETIGDYAFNNSSITAMPELPDTLTYIGSNAFAGIEFTGSLTLPDSVTTIGSYAFYNGKFTSLDLGSGVRSIGKGAFSNAQVEELVIPDSMASLDIQFINCSRLKSIDFGNSSVDIEGFFINDKTTGLYECLEEIKASSDNAEFTTLDGVLYSKDMTRLILFPNAKELDTYTTPDTVKTISKFAFTLATRLKNVIVGDSVRELREQAFYCTCVENVTISGRVEAIGPEAFAESENLRNVTFGDGLNVPRLLKAFYNSTALEEVTFGSNSTVGTMDETFAKSSVKNVILPDKITRLDNTFFLAKNLESVTMPTRLEAMVETFSNSGIMSIDIPKTIEVITSGCFEYCQRLSEVTLHGVKSIGAYAFSSCISLESIDLTGVTFVDETAFLYCDNLKKLYFTADEQDTVISEYEFQGNDTIETIIVGNSVTEIQDYAFADCQQLKDAFIADSVTEIADTAFDNCDSLSILCTEGSYAMSFAERMSIPYTTFLVAPIPDQEYTGFEITPPLDVSAQSRELTLGNDYTAVYTDNINVGTAKVNVIGLGDYSIFACLTRFGIVAPASDNGDVVDVEQPQPNEPQDSVTAPADSNNSINQPVDNTVKPIESTTAPVTTPQPDTSGEATNPPAPQTEETTTSASSNQLPPQPENNIPTAPDNGAQPQPSNSGEVNTQPTTSATAESNSSHSAEATGNTTSPNATQNEVTENQTESSQPDSDKAKADDKAATDTDSSTEPESWFKRLLNKLKTFLQKLIALIKSLF